MTLLPDNLILFDGVCNLCTKSVQFIIRHDKATPLTKKRPAVLTQREPMDRRKERWILLSK